MIFTSKNKPKPKSLLPDFLVLLVEVEQWKRKAVELELTVGEFIAFKLPDRRVEDSTDDLLDNRVEDSTDDQLETGTDKVRQVKGKFSDTSIGSTLVQENVSSWLETTGNKY